MEYVIKRMMPAPCERVFRAWSDPSVMARWFFAEMGWSAQVRNEFRVGGTYQLDMLDQGLTVFSAHGEYREIVPVTRLAFTWNSAVVQNTIVIVELHDMGEATELTLTHQSLPDEKQVTQHGVGWEACLENLTRYLSGGKLKMFKSIREEVALNATPEAIYNMLMNAQKHSAFTGAQPMSEKNDSDLVID